ncbi:MAG TPA: type II toxin-antitoxin system VapC family toxin [Caulobacteraceae bacterium]|nr:type II toxin-antitoxin system VapC family toxin [Caulobacteraceae bacterium]
MPHLLDTNIAIHLRDRDPAITDRVAGLEPPIVLSILSRVELEGGVYSDPSQSASRRLRLDVVFDTVGVLPFDEADADVYRWIVETVGYSRRKVFDGMIAAQAIVHRATLVTRNGDDFRDIPGLRMLEW